MISQLNQYQHLQAIYILQFSKNTDDLRDKIHDGKASFESGAKIIKSFYESELLFTSLQELITETEKSLKDVGLFTTCESPEKALRDLKHELGSFVWTHTFRG